MTLLPCVSEITEEDEEKSAEVEDDRTQEGEEEGKTSGDGRNSGGVPEDSQKMTDVEYSKWMKNVAVMIFM